MMARMLPRLFPLLLLFPLASRAGEAAPVASPPTLKISKPKFRADPPAVEFAFTLTNPGDQPVFLDCQGEPRVALVGRSLRLGFGGPDSAGAAASEAGGAGRPLRVGARQTFAGTRLIDGIPTGFTNLIVEMAYYPERVEGEGEPYLREQAGKAVAQPVLVLGAGRRKSAPAPGGKKAP